MKIGILSDGKYGDRAYDNIKRRYSTAWILVESPDSPIVDDAKLDVPECDLYISYLRHPDLVLALLEKKVPTILGVSFGLGFLRQAREVSEKVIAPITMCSLEDNTGIKEFDEFARYYGRPKFKIAFKNNRVAGIELLRESPCGSTRAAVRDIIGVPLSEEMLQFFALRVCHNCRAPRFGRTCDKEFSGILHVHELVNSVPKSEKEIWSAIAEYSEEIEGMYQQKVSSHSAD